MLHDSIVSPLDEYDPAKNVIEWAKVGLSSEEMTPFLPGPQTSGLQSDIVNGNIVDMIIVSLRSQLTISLIFEAYFVHSLKVGF